MALNYFLPIIKLHFITIIYKPWNLKEAIYLDVVWLLKVFLFNYIYIYIKKKHEYTNIFNIIIIIPSNVSAVVFWLHLLSESRIYSFSKALVVKFYIIVELYYFLSLRFSY